MIKKKNDIGMAKQPKYPLTGELKEFTRITEENRKKAVIIGRIFYYFRITPRKNICTGFFCISPLLKKGWNKIPNFPWDLAHPYVDGKTHWNCYYESDTDKAHWIKTHDHMITHGIKEGILYIRLSDPILIFNPK